MNYVDKLFSLAGKTAVVAGGTGELCGAMALAMARAGAEVVGKSGECQILDSGYAAMTI